MSDAFQLVIFWFSALAAGLLVYFGIRDLRQATAGHRQKPVLMILAGLVILLNLLMWVTMPAAAG